MRRRIVLITILIFCSGLIIAQEADSQNNQGVFQILDSIIGGFVGGIVGVLGTIASSYWGPRKLEEWRQNQIENRISGPRKRLLLSMLEDQRFPNGRRLKTMSRVTGTDYEECRRLLIEINARGLIPGKDTKGDYEYWALIKNKPITEE